MSGAGTERWRATYDTPDADWPVWIEVDAAGRSFVGGMTQRVEPLQVLVNAFIVSCDANGNLLWQDQYVNGPDQETIYDIARDPIGGAVYVAGGASGQNGGPLLLRYDAHGRRRWAKRYPGHGAQAFAERVAVGKKLWSFVYGGLGTDERVSGALRNWRVGGQTGAGDERRCVLEMAARGRGRMGGSQTARSAANSQRTRAASPSAPAYTCVHLGVHNPRTPRPSSDSSDTGKGNELNNSFVRCPSPVALKSLDPLGREGSNPSPGTVSFLQLAE